MLKKNYNSQCIFSLNVLSKHHPSLECSPVCFFKTTNYLFQQTSNLTLVLITLIILNQDICTIIIYIKTLKYVSAALEAVEVVSQMGVLLRVGDGLL